MSFPFPKKVAKNPCAKKLLFSVSSSPFALSDWAFWLSPSKGWGARWWLHSKFVSPPFWGDSSPFSHHHGRKWKFCIPSYYKKTDIGDSYTHFPLNLWEKRVATPLKQVEVEPKSGIHVIIITSDTVRGRRDGISYGKFVMGDSTGMSCWYLVNEWYPPVN